MENPGECVSANAPANTEGKAVMEGAVEKDLEKEATAESKSAGGTDGTAVEHAGMADSGGKEPGKADDAEVDPEKKARILKRQYQTGMAPIKPEFIDFNHKRVLVEDFLPPSVVDDLKAETRESEDGPPSKKQKKAKGVNKNRFQGRPQVPQSERICLAVLHGKDSDCKYGDQCRFSHDLAAYMAKKSADLGDKCYLFDTQGRCPYGIMCCFAKSHTSDDFTNIVNEKLWEASQKETTYLNVLSKEAQFKLRKRQYNFKMSEKLHGLVRQKAFDKLPEARAEILAARDKKHLTSAEATNSTSVDPGVKKNSDLGDKLDICISKIKAKSPKSNSSSPKSGTSPVSKVKVEENSTTPSEEKSQNDGVESSASVEKSDQEASVTQTVSVKKSEEDIQNMKVEKSDLNENVAIKAASDKLEAMLNREAVIKDSETVSGDAPSDVGTSKSGGASNLPVYDINNRGIPKVAGTDADGIRIRPQEKKRVNFEGKLYLAPLTTVGNLPFRRMCKTLGADITCGEMALVTNLLQAQKSEWALMKRHSSEDIFGVQICGSYPDTMMKAAQLLTEQCDLDFIDINCGCPIDLIYKRGEGCAMMGRHSKFEEVIRGMTSVMGEVPLTVKIRTGIFEDKPIAHTLVPKLRDWGVAMTTMHGRSREQRYTKLADWDYISECGQLAAPMPFFGCGDILSYEEANRELERPGVSGLMIARGALVKPWVFTEIKEQRHWDISSSERFDILKTYVNYGLEHWGSDEQGVSKTRHFMLEWLSFLHRYIPVGLLERVPQRLNEKPPYYFGRNDLETLMASSNASDWVRITEMLLGPVPQGFYFVPKHKANAYK